MVCLYTYIPIDGKGRGAIALADGSVSGGMVCQFAGRTKQNNEKKNELRQPESTDGLEYSLSIYGLLFFFGVLIARVAVAETAAKTHSNVENLIYNVANLNTRISVAAM